MLQLSQAPSFINAHATVLLFPFEKRGLRDTQFSTNFGYCLLWAFLLAQGQDNLLFRKLTLFHFKISFLLDLNGNLCFHTLPKTTLRSY